MVTTTKLDVFPEQDVEVPCSPIRNDFSMGIKPRCCCNLEKKYSNMNIEVYF